MRTTLPPDPSLSLGMTHLASVTAPSQPEQVLLREQERRYAGWLHRFSQPRNLGTSEPRNLATSQPPSNQATQKPRLRDDEARLVLRNLATSQPRNLATNTMPTEIEVKFPLKDRAGLTQKLHELGARQLYPETFEDNIVLDRRGELRTKGALLRVRKFGKYALATYKGPMAIEAGIKSREEVQTGVESFELAIQIFDALGYKPVFRYQKFSEVWRLRETEVVIDRTPIGDYFEIEGSIDTLRAVAADLGMNMDQAIRPT